MLMHKVTGTPGKPWLIFFNSLGCDWSMWDGQVALMADSRQILLINKPGHGGAPVETANPLNTIEGLAGAVVELMDHLGIETAEYCGLSIGGRVGTVLGGDYASRFSKLVLVCAGMGDPDKADFWSGRIDAAQDKGMAVVAKASAARWFTDGFVAQHPGQVDRVAQMIAKCDQAGYIHAVEALRDQDTQQATSNISCPTLVVAGARDMAAPVADVRKMSDLINGAHYVELDAGHIMNIEAEAAFNRGLVNFLEG